MALKLRAYRGCGAQAFEFGAPKLQSKARREKELLQFLRVDVEEGTLPRSRGVVPGGAQVSLVALNPKPRPLTPGAMRFNLIVS